MLLPSTLSDIVNRKEAAMGNEALSSFVTLIDVETSINPDIILNDFDMQSFETDITFI